MNRIPALLAALAFATPCLAADGPNIIANADFAKFTSVENLWDGVDSANYLSGNKQATYALKGDWAGLKTYQATLKSGRKT